MTRALRFSRAEIANAALVCREHQVAVRLGRDGSMVVFPAPPATPLDTGDEDDLDAELAAFEAKHGGDRA